MKIITQLSELDVTQTYSYADYVTWQFEEMVELIKGKIMTMSPAPNVKHQSISGNLYVNFHTFFKNKRCRVFHAPFDVRLYDRKKSILQNKEIYTVVQPDLCIICNTDYLDEQGCNGAPDLIVEILSKGNSKREMTIKYNLYQESGVLEYWIVYPYEQAVHQFVLNDKGLYELKGMYSSDENMISHLFSDLVIDLSEVFN